MTRILITGTSSGFGRLATITLARQGHQVIATMRDGSKAQDLIDECRSEGLEVEVRRLDVGDPESVSEALADADAIDAIVNKLDSRSKGRSR